VIWCISSDLETSEEEHNLFALRPNYVSCSIIRFDIVETIFTSIDGKGNTILGAHQVIWGSGVKKNTIFFAFRPNYVSCSIYRFDIVETILHQLH
jgi:hypothetical protein